MKRFKMICVLTMLVITFVNGKNCMEDNGIVAFAQEINVEYSYDAAGRLICVTYPDGRQIHYEYDKNGNMTSNQITKKESTTEENTTQENEGNNKNYIVKGTGHYRLDLASISSNELGQMRDTPQDKKAYKKFKKKKPVIKSLKVKKTKKKYDLNIQIKKISGLGNYQESGYEVKYATNKKFKKAQTIRFAKKASVTGGKWKVTKGKQYWVKVRAYMKTRAGKIIYSKYSKVMKIKVNK